MRSRRIWLLVLLVVAVASAGVGAYLLSRDDTSATPVIVDYSPTLSDVPALMYVAARPDVDLLAVTLPGTGESSCDAGVRHTRELLALVGKEDVPVGCGSERPIEGDREWPEPWRAAADGLSGPIVRSVPEAPTPDAVDLLTDTLADAPAPVTVLTLGPLTNLGELARDHPDTLENVERIVTMGGAVDVPGNVEQEPAAEWNLYIDPEADRLVLASGVPVTLVGLDATNDVPGNRQLVARARLARDGPAAVAVSQLWDANADFVAGEGFYFWDELAAAAMLEPELVTFEPRTIGVDDRGATIERVDGTPVTVATSADRELFEQHLLDTLNGAPVPEPEPLTDEQHAYGKALEATFEEVVGAREAVWAGLGPGVDPHVAAPKLVQAIEDAWGTLDEGLASADPPPEYAEAHDAMRAALDRLNPLLSEALAALDSPKAAAAENPLDVVTEVVGERFDEHAAEFAVACRRVADDLALRGGFDLDCRVVG